MPFTLMNVLLMLVIVSAVHLRLTVLRISRFKESLGHAHLWKRFSHATSTPLLFGIILHISCASSFLPSVFCFFVSLLAKKPSEAM